VIASRRTKEVCRVPAIDFNELRLAFAVLDDAFVELWLRALYNWEVRAGSPAVLKVIAACRERSRERIRKRSNATIRRKRTSTSSALEFTRDDALSHVLASPLNPLPTATRSPVFEASRIINRFQ